MLVMQKNCCPCCWKLPSQPTPLPVEPSIIPVDPEAPFGRDSAGIPYRDPYRDDDWYPN